MARVFLRPGTGEIKVNNRAFENYFPTESTRAVVRQALAATETTDKFDLIILANGGGFKGYGCVGDGRSSGTSLFGTGRSSTP